MLTQSVVYGINLLVTDVVFDTYFCSSVAYYEVLELRTVSCSAAQAAFMFTSVRDLSD